jgi:AcrR family transcriptional regulator
VSPQRSNRSQLIDGTLRCLERLPAERVTARAIAEESGANLASITYHFGSKEDLVTEAVGVGLDRWLQEIDAALAGVTTGRYDKAADIVAATRHRHEGLARTFLAALTRAAHDERVRATLAAGFRRTRSAVADVLGTGRDRAGLDAAALTVALFNGLLFQTLVDPDLAIEGDRFHAAQQRLAGVRDPAGSG